MFSTFLVSFYYVDGRQILDLYTTRRGCVGIESLWNTCFNFFNLEVVCPMLHKTIPVENYDLRHDSNYKLEEFDFEFEQKPASSRHLLKWRLLTFDFLIVIGTSIYIRQLPASIFISCSPLPIQKYKTKVNQIQLLRCATLFSFIQKSIFISCSSVRIQQYNWQHNKTKVNQKRIVSCTLYNLVLDSSIEWVLKMNFRELSQ